MKLRVPVTLASVAALGFSSGTAHASLSQQVNWELWELLPPNGGIPECYKNVNGSYGSLFYTNTTAWMSLGAGTCATQNTRPKDFLQARSSSFYGQSLIQDSGWVKNPETSHFVQATVSYGWYANNYSSRSSYKISWDGVYHYGVLHYR